MATVTIGQVRTVRVRKGEQLTVVTAASSTALVTHKNRIEGSTDVSETSMIASQTKYFGPFANDEVFEISCLTGSLTESISAVDLRDLVDAVTLIGAQAAQPSVGSVTMNLERVGMFYKLDFTFTGAQFAHTDAAGSGSSGSLKLFDFVEGVVVPMACTHNLTLTGDDLIDGDVGDMAGVVAFGSAAANAGDGALTGTEVSFCATAAFTLSSYVDAVGTVVNGQGSALDGTATPAALYLNESGSAATSEATGVLTVDGTATFLVAVLGDD